MKCRSGLILFVALQIVSCKQNDKNEEPKTFPLFYGMVTYSITLNAADTSLLQNFAPFIPSKVEIFYAENKFRMIEYGGASHGNILVFRNKQEAWQLDTIEKMAYLSDYSDLNEPSEDLMDMMPDHFAPTLEPVNETENILGYNCKKYKIARSGFIPAADEAYIWVTEDFAFPSSRYDVESEINHVIVPLPLYLGFEDGAIMKLQVANKNYSATYQIVELKKNIDQSVFTIPENFSKK